MDYQSRYMIPLRRENFSYTDKKYMDSHSIWTSNLPWETSVTKNRVYTAAVKLRNCKNSRGCVLESHGYRAKEIKILWESYWRAVCKPVLR